MKRFLSLVKFEHTLFAMPFALIGFFLGIYRGDGDTAFTWLLLVQIIFCMVFARNAAMGFNRYVDKEIDAINPRTKDREIPSGKISSKVAVGFILVNIGLFLFTAYTINILCFYLAFPALLLLLGYSYTKRFTSFCHLILGLVLAIAPSAAYIAVTGTVSLAVMALSFLVLFWVTGFDILYSLSDIEFDKNNNLYSIPRLLGEKRAFRISEFLHILVIPMIFIFYHLADMSWLYLIGSACFTAALIYQHLIVTPNNLKRLNAAFFTSNGVASILFALFGVLDLIFL